MGANTKIEWCHATFNPWWGCEKISPACAHCYAATFAHRLGLDIWGDKAPRRFFEDKHWAEPRKWNRAACIVADASGGTSERPRVFCASMADVFEDRDELIPHRQRLFDLIEECTALDWLLLTKRPENMVAMTPMSWAKQWPRNVWAMTSVESQAYVGRIDELLKVPAVVRGISAEPLLGALDLKLTRTDRTLHELRRVRHFPGFEHAGKRCRIHWTIVGGESGPGARPSHPDWFRSLRDQCVAAGVAFHFKQWGEICPPDQLPESEFVRWDAANNAAGNPARHEPWRFGKKRSGRLLDGRTWDQVPQPFFQPAEVRP